MSNLRIRLKNTSSPVIKSAVVKRPEVKAIIFKKATVLKVKTGGIFISASILSKVTNAKVKKARILTPTVRTLEVLKKPTIQNIKIDKPTISSIGFQAKIRLKSLRIERLIVDAFVLLQQPVIEAVGNRGNQKTVRLLQETLANVRSIVNFGFFKNFTEQLKIESVIQTKTFGTIKSSSIQLDAADVNVIRGITVGEPTNVVTESLRAELFPIRNETSNIGIQSVDPLFSYLILQSSVLHTKSFPKVVRIFNQNPLSNVQTNSFASKGFFVPNVVNTLNNITKFFKQGEIQNNQIKTLAVPTKLFQQGTNEETINLDRTITKTFLASKNETINTLNNITKFFKQGEIQNNQIKTLAVPTKLFIKPVSEIINLTNFIPRGTLVRNNVNATSTIIKKDVKKPIVNAARTNADIVLKDVKKPLINTVNLDHIIPRGRLIRNNTYAKSIVKKLVLKPINNKVYINIADNEENLQFKTFFKNHLTHQVDLTNFIPRGRLIRNNINATSTIIKKDVKKPIVNTARTNADIVVKDVKKPLINTVNLDHIIPRGFFIKTMVLTIVPFLRKKFNKEIGNFGSLPSKVQTDADIVIKDVVKPIITPITFTHLIPRGKLHLLSINTNSNILEKFAKKVIGHFGSEPSKVRSKVTVAKFVRKPLISGIGEAGSLGEFLNVGSRVVTAGPFQRANLNVFSIPTKLFHKVSSSTLATDSKISDIVFKRPVFSNIQTTSIITATGPFRRTEASTNSLPEKQPRLLLDRLAVGERREEGIYLKSITNFLFARTFVNTVNIETRLLRGFLRFDSIKTSSAIQKVDFKTTKNSSVSINVVASLSPSFSVRSGPVITNSNIFFRGSLALENININMNLPAKKDIKQGEIQNQFVNTNSISTKSIAKSSINNLINTKSNLLRGFFRSNFVNINNIIAKDIKQGEIQNQFVQINVRPNIQPRPTKLAEVQTQSLPIPSYAVIPENYLLLNDAFFLIFKRKDPPTMFLETKSAIIKKPNVVREFGIKVIVSLIRGIVNSKPIIVNTVSIPEKQSKKPRFSAIQVNTDKVINIPQKSLEESVVLFNRVLSGRILFDSVLNTSIVEKELRKPRLSNVSISGLDGTFKKESVKPTISSVRTNVFSFKGRLYRENIKTQSDTIKTPKLLKANFVRTNSAITEKVVRATLNTSILKVFSEVSTAPVRFDSVNTDNILAKLFSAVATNKVKVEDNIFTKRPMRNVENATAVADSGVLYNQSYSKEYFLTGYVGDERVLT